MRQRSRCTFANTHTYIANTFRFKLCTTSSAQTVTNSCRKFVFCFQSAKYEVWKWSGTSIPFMQNELPNRNKKICCQLNVFVRQFSLIHRTTLMQQPPTSPSSLLNIIIIYKCGCVDGENRFSGRPMCCVR